MAGHDNISFQKTSVVLQKNNKMLEGLFINLSEVTKWRIRNLEFKKIINCKIIQFSNLYSNTLNFVSKVTLKANKQTSFQSTEVTNLLIQLERSEESIHGNRTLYAVFWRRYKKDETSRPLLALEKNINERIRFNMNIFFLLMVEHHSFGVALTTPSKRKY